MTKAKKAAYEAAKKQQTQRENLIAAAIEKWGVSDIMEALYEAADDDGKDSLKWWAEYLLTIGKGAIIISPQSMAETDAIKGFLDTLYPYCNQQQQVLKFA